MPPAKKRQRYNNPVFQSDPLSLPCEWGECTQVYNDMDYFMNHVTLHLNSVELNNVEETGEGNPCPWRECEYVSERDNNDFVRHIFFHCFHVKIKSFGTTLLQKNKIQQSCMLESGSRNMIPELPEQLQCGWKHCEAICDNPERFYQHIANHCDSYPDGNNPKGGCACLWEGCEHVTKSKHKLKDHMRSHTQQKLVACPTCGGLFSNRTKFFDHVKRQSDETQSYQCSHCNKCYSTERLLRDHMRNHVNHYKCPFCDMTCPSPSGLRNHIKYRHNDEKPFTCEHCDYRCKTSADIRKHLESHNDEANFQCQVQGCDFQTTAYHLLSRHYKTHKLNATPKPVYACHICSVKYTRGQNLTAHLRQVHKLKWPSGHTRFRYKLHEDNAFRLQTVRYESIELTEEILKGRMTEGGSNLPPVTEEGSRQEETQESGKEGAYNLMMLGEVALKDNTAGQSSEEGSQHSSQEKGNSAMTHNSQVDNTTSDTHTFELPSSSGHNLQHNENSPEVVTYRLQNHVEGVTYSIPETGLHNQNTNLEYNVLGTLDVYQADTNTFTGMDPNECSPGVVGPLLKQQTEANTVAQRQTGVSQDQISASSNSEHSHMTELTPLHGPSSQQEPATEHMSLENHPIALVAGEPGQPGEGALTSVADLIPVEEIHNEEGMRVVRYAPIENH